MDYTITPIGFVRSTLVDLAEAPRQGDEGAPEAWLDLEPGFAAVLLWMSEGDELVLLTWFHRADRDMLQVHPRGNPEAPLTGVFATRSPHRPNPIGLHLVTVLEIDGNLVQVEPLEAIDGTPVVDIKPVLGPIETR